VDSSGSSPSTSSGTGAVSWPGSVPESDSVPELVEGRRPLIGVTTYLEQSQTGDWDVPASFLPKVYLDSVTNAGGIAILLPPQPVDAAIAASVVERLDGLVVAGGKDVNPARYGQDAHPTTDSPRLDRDAWEDALLTAAIDAGLPFLAICRGLQILNVALGGTLHQHLPDVIGDARFSGGHGVFAQNEVTLGTAGVVPMLLAATPTLTVQSYHHQAIDVVAPGLRVTAESGGVVQAVELTGQPFGVAVQWHPEQNPEDLRLFAGLVDAARSRRAG
jgi:putative glutamine amidotransferase